jgi:hypothetical protein
MSTEPVIEAPDLAAYLKQQLVTVVRDFCQSRPRATQVAIGPSEIGNPCDRALALKSLGYPDHDAGTHFTGDPWASFVGSAVHARLEKAFLRDNAQHADDMNEQRWRIETRVEVATGISGTADLYNAETRTVIDHKVPGDYIYKKALAGDVSETYLTQLQCYGYGFTRLGFPVSNVALAFWQRGNGAHLNGLHVMVWPYDPGTVHNALTRWYQLSNAAADLDLERFPERAVLLATADAPCRWCPFLKVGGGVNVGQHFACPGHKPRH